MDRIEKYEKIIIEKFTKYADSWNQNEEVIKSQPIIDLAGKHYQLIRYGWKKNDEYIHYCVFHIDIINSKVWIQENRTDILIAEELVKLGIEKNDIVLGLLPPQQRKDSEYSYG